MFKFFAKNESFKNNLKVLNDSDSSKEAVFSAGELILLVILGGKKEVSLDEMRARKYLVKLAAQDKRAVKLEALGPTTDAARQHILRVFFQVEEWKGHKLNPEMYGFKMNTFGLMPIKMTKEIAPPQLLKIISCGCKTDCSRKNCSCKKHGVLCSNMCSACRGVSCLNSERAIEPDE